MNSPDVCIAGAGIIGLTLALALHRRGRSVAVLSAGDPMAEASSAAAGMLAVEDPDNPAALRALSRFSRDLYPALLESLRLPGGGPAVRFQTHRCLQVGAASAAAVDLSAEAAESFPSTLHRVRHSFVELQEESLDPRELAAALLAAVKHSGILLQQDLPALAVEESATGTVVTTRAGDVPAGQFVDCTGAWSLSSARVPSLQIVPRKGQMLTVTTPAVLAEGCVLRSHEIYLVPRLHGARAGQTVVGATVEDAGFDRTLRPEDLQGLLEIAAQYVPEVRSARILERWSGLRPATSDLLPALGRLPGSAHCYVASGHYRNGILLAPGTAEVMAGVLAGETPPVPLEAFSPGRFETAAGTLTDH